MTGGKAILESLKRHGVKVIFGLPGGAILPLYDDIYKDKDIRHILVRHEQVAAHASDGFARASGKPGICMATSGPGATNLTTGIANAYMDSSPVIAFTGQVARPLIGNDAFQETDACGITLPITKHNFKIMKTKEIPQIIKMAFKIATTGRPGPVHIDLPRDVQSEETDFDFEAEPEMPGYKPTIEGHPLQIKRAAEIISEAERPIVLAGGGVIHSNASPELSVFAEMLGSPVTTTFMGKSSFPENHPLALGTIGMHGKKAANKAVTESDVLIAIGCRFSDRSTGNVQYFAQNAKIIHIDIDPAEIGKNIKIFVPIVGDAKRVLKSLIERLKEIYKKGKTTAWVEKINQFKKEFQPKMDYDEIPIKPQRVMKELNSIIDSNTIITTEVGQNQMWAGHFLEVHHPRQFISSGGLGTMGFGFPAAIGAKVARPEATVIDVAGDGSFLMVEQDLATCVLEKIPVIVLILDNRRLGMVSQWQELFYGGRLSATLLGESPDFVKLTEAYGAKAEYVTRPNEIRPALERAIKSNEPYVLDVIVDPKEHVLPMVPPGGRLDQMIG
ncbi:MAG: acetolactate synthase large subunit [Euryarchaeota archaeon]|nr:acetolactate synthase large subunit [Euryarchaeota archaeon]